MLAHYRPRTEQRGRRPAARPAVADGRRRVVRSDAAAPDGIGADRAPPSRRVLLRWHARQQAWLQVGGHADPGRVRPAVDRIARGSRRDGPGGPGCLARWFDRPHGHRAGACRKARGRARACRRALRARHGAARVGSSRESERRTPLALARRGARAEHRGKPARDAGSARTRARPTAPCPRGERLVRGEAWSRSRNECSGSH